MLAGHPSELTSPEFEQWWKDNQLYVEAYKSRYGLTLKDFGKLVWITAAEKAEKEAMDSERLAMIHTASMCEGT